MCIIFQSIGAIIGYGEFLTSREVFTWAGQAFCSDQVVFQPICSNMIFLLGGWNEPQHNAVSEKSLSLTKIKLLIIL